MNKARDEFLDWYGSLSAKDSDEVCAVTAYEIWKAAWQASRKALVVELPDMIEVWNEDEKHYSRAYLKDGVEFALNQNGINYK